MRGAAVPMQLINGRADVVAGLCWVKKLAKQLRCPLILTGARPDILIENQANMLRVQAHLLRS